MPCQCQPNGTNSCSYRFFVFLWRPALVPAHRGVVISRFCVCIWKCTRGKRFGGLCFCVWGPALGPKPSKEAWVQHKRTLVQVLLDCSGGLGANMITSSLLIHKISRFFFCGGGVHSCVCVCFAMLPCCSSCFCKVVVLL